LQKVNKQVEGKVSMIRDQRTKKSRETREQLKGCETRKVLYTRRYTSGHLIPRDYMSFYLFYIICLFVQYYVIIQ